LKQEIQQAVGEYIIDVKDFRTEDKARLLKDVHALMYNRFDVAQHLLTTKPWDFFMMVDMGVDRLHHGFWKYCDPAHPKFAPGNPFRDAFRNYYQALDARIGDLLSQVGEETAVLVVSDHGAKAMAGGVCINQWLINEGLLKVRDTLDHIKRIEDCTIDWPATQVWGSGGYYGRIFINVRGREPQGTVSPEEYETFRDALIEKIEAMADHEGRPLGNKAYKPEDLYARVTGVAPDLFVYFGGLSWRAVGSVGFDSIHTFDNDTGPDDANHDFDGILIMDDRSGRHRGEQAGLNIIDVAPTILDLFGIDVPGEMQGKSIR
jgi:predicted AlkP superfamily phosphohydrolase/phosphomutase